MTMRNAHPSRGRLARLARGIGALIALVAVVVGVPALMIGLHLIPHSVPSLHQLGQDLKAHDDGQLAVVVIAAGVWICWLLFTLSLFPEIVAAARKRPAHPLPGLGAFQRPAGSLVAAIAIAFTIAPMIGGMASNRADAAPAPLPHAPTVATASATPTSHQAPDTARPQQDGTHTTSSVRQTPVRTTHPTYVVKQRDTLWGIAENHLGDPMRYTEIVQLNSGAVGPDNEITPGTELVMPADATGVAPATQTADAASSSSTHVTVKPGDTLWSIEQRLTGSGTNWQTGWDANQGRVEPGGDRFTDKNLIQPGWELDIPTSATASTTTPAKPPSTTPRTTPSTPPVTKTPPAKTAPTRTSPPRSGDQAPASPSTTSTPNAPATPATPVQTAPAQATPAPSHEREHASAASENRYLSLEVGGGLLAATTFATLMVLRRRKFRHRRAGHVVASLPPELIPLEQALVVNGRAALAA